VVASSANRREIESREDTHAAVSSMQTYWPIDGPQPLYSTNKHDPKYFCVQILRYDFIILSTNLCSAVFGWACPEVMYHGVLRPSSQIIILSWRSGPWMTQPSSASAKRLRPSEGGPPLDAAAMPPNLRIMRLGTLGGSDGKLH
jgi:hypothetical protein